MNLLPLFNIHLVLLIYFATTLPSEANRIDKFEPDEDNTASRHIAVGETQSHTFHTMARGDFSDWLHFDQPQNGSLYGYKVIITQISNSAVAQVNFYNTTGANFDLAAKITTGITSTTVNNQVIYTISCSILARGHRYKMELPRGTSAGTLDYDVEFVSDTPVGGSVGIYGSTAIALE